MKKWFPALLLGSCVASAAAIAQTSPPTTAPAPKPAMPPAQTDRAPAETDRMAAPKSLTLSESEAKNWVDKPVYSGDNKNIGEVAAFVRDASGKVSEMHADIGGFLGIGETRVRLMPTQFTLSGDRVILNISSEQAKTLPKVTK